MTDDPKLTCTAAERALIEAALQTFKGLADHSPKTVPPQLAAILAVRRERLEADLPGAFDELRILAREYTRVKNKYWALHNRLADVDPVLTEAIYTETEKT